MQHVMAIKTYQRLALAGLCSLFLAGQAAAQTSEPAEPAAMAESISPRILSAVSGGYWETVAEAKPEDDSTQSAETAEGAQMRGYYRIVSLRSADNTSRLFLQRIQLTETGPELFDSQEVTALGEMNAYITDMRPENSTGIAQGPGFAAFIYLKLDPAVEEPETFELFVDDLGDLSFMPATN